MVGLAPPDTPTPTPLVGRVRRSPPPKTTRLPCPPIVDVTTLAVLVGVLALREVVGTTPAAPTRRPRRLLGPPVALVARRVAAGVRGGRPQIGLAMVVVGQVDAATETTGPIYVGRGVTSET